MKIISLAKNFLYTCTGEEKMMKSLKKEMKITSKTWKHLKTKCIKSRVNFKITDDFFWKFQTTKKFRTLLIKKSKIFFGWKLKVTLKIYLLVYTFLKKFLVHKIVFKTFPTRLNIIFETIKFNSVLIAYNLYWF